LRINSPSMNAGYSQRVGKSSGYSPHDRELIKLISLGAPPFLCQC
jgi:hypothetical protein